MGTASFLNAVFRGRVSINRRRYENSRIVRNCFDNLGGDSSLPAHRKVGPMIFPIVCYLILLLLFPFWTILVTIGALIFTVLFFILAVAEAFFRTGVKS